jgi:hypothetical protein
MVKHTFVLLSIVAACACSRAASTPKAAREGASPAAPASTATSPWLGEHEYRSTDGNGSLVVAMKGARAEVTLEVAQTDGCTGSVGGTLEISGTHARLAPPLFVVDGSMRHQGTDPCELEFGLRDNGTIDVSEGVCVAYQGIACGFAGDYPPIVER